MPLACVWHTKQFYTASAVPRNGVGGLADEKPLVFMPLSWNGFTVLTHVTSLAFQLFTNIIMMLLT